MDKEIKKEYTQLEYVIVTGDLEGLKKLLEKGMDPNSKNEHEDEDRPLHLAVLEGNVSVLKLLLDYGADLSLPDKNGKRPIHYAAVAGDAEVIEFLLERGADPTTQDNDGNTALHATVDEFENVEVVKLFLEKNPEIVNIRNNKGKTALELAIEGEKNDTVALLQAKHPNH